jgi:hypothetical protein
MSLQWADPRYNLQLNPAFPTQSISYLPRLAKVQVQLCPSGSSGHLGDLPGLVVAPQYRDPLPEANLQGDQQGDLEGQGIGHLVITEVRLFITDRV